MTEQSPLSDSFRAELDLAMGSASDPGQPLRTYRGLERVLSLWIGHKLFTVLRYDLDRGVAERVHSSRPDLYPATGTKAFDEAPTMRRVRDSGEIQVAWTTEEVRDAFPDHERMRAMGCGAIMNVPIVVDGQVVAQFNLSHEAGHFQPGHLTLALEAAAKAAPVFAIRARQSTPAVS